MKNLIYLSIILLILSCSISVYDGTDNEYGAIDISDSDTMRVMRSIDNEGSHNLNKFDTIIAQYNEDDEDILFYDCTHSPPYIDYSIVYPCGSEVSSYYILDTLLFLSIDDSIEIVNIELETGANSEVNCFDAGRGFDCIIVIDSTIIASNSQTGIYMFRMDSACSAESIYCNNEIYPDTMIYHNDYLYVVDEPEIDIMQIEGESLSLITSLSGYQTSKIKLSGNMLVYYINDKICITDIEDKSSPEDILKQDLGFYRVDDFVLVDSFLYVVGDPEDDSDSGVFKFRCDSTFGFVLESHNFLDYGMDKILTMSEFLIVQGWYTVYAFRQ